MTDLDRRCGRIRRDELPHSIAFEQTAQEKIAVEKAENLLARSGDVIAQQEQMIAGMNTFVTESMSGEAKKKLGADGVAPSLRRIAVMAPRSTKFEPGAMTTGAPSDEGGSRRVSPRLCQMRP